jgi:predicted nucleotidyltransferase
MDKNDAVNAATRYAKYLKTKHCKVKNVFMFGSYCRGEYNENSDIDIAIVMERVSDSFNMMLKLMKYRRSIDIRIEPHVFKRSEFNRQNPFAQRVMNSGVKIL